MVGSSLRPPWWEERRDTTRGLGGDPARRDGSSGRWLDPELAGGALAQDDEQDVYGGERSEHDGTQGDGATEDRRTLRRRRIYPMGINRNHLEQAIRELGVPAVISRDEREADAVMVLKSLYRKQGDRVDAFQSAGLPVYILRTAAVDRLREALADLYRVDLDRARPAVGEDTASDLTSPPYA